MTEMVSDNLPEDPRSNAQVELDADRAFVRSLARLVSAADAVVTAHTIAAAFDDLGRRSIALFRARLGDVDGRLPGPSLRDEAPIARRLFRWACQLNDLPAPPKREARCRELRQDVAALDDLGAHYLRELKDDVLAMASRGDCARCAWADCPARRP